MTHDLVIRNGTLVDGTGGTPRPADVAISGDRIARVGEVPEAGQQEIDAAGRIVTPGFIDIHTHLDAQIMWDPQVTSPCWHGITTAVMGNCGLSLAPARPGQAEFLIHLLSNVEDIPAEAILEGNRFTGESFADYLDLLEALPTGVNVAAMIGHTAVRYYAMGERSMEEGAAPNDSEMQLMRELVKHALDAGAMGFSTSRSLLHTTPDGRHVPGTFAAYEELLEFGKILGEHGRGMFGWVSPVEAGDARLHEREIDWMQRISQETGTPFTFAVIQNRENPTLYRESLDQIDAANRAGAKLHPQTEVRSIGVVVGLANITPFDQSLAWHALKELSVKEKLEALRDPERRAQLVRGGNEASSEGQLSMIYHLCVKQGNARYDFSPEDSLWAIAKQRAVSPADAFIDMLLETDGQACFIFPFANFEIDAVQELLLDRNMLLGLADSGAHVSQICDTSFSTYFLSYWVGERSLMSLEEGIRKLTSEPAEIFGFADRGVVREGAFADLNVINLDALKVLPPEFRNDFPAGAGRYIQRAEGIDLTLVNGEVFMKDGEHQGAYAGRLLRSV